MRSNFRFLLLILFFALSGISLLVYSSRTHSLPVKKSSKAVKDTFAWHDGDLIFQVNVSGQGKAVQLATGSKYTHVGMVITRNGIPWVFEAVQPVKFTPLESFINRGDGNHYVVKRLLSDSLLTAAKVKAMQKMAGEYEGKDYDLYFGWSDERIYCSELVWKIYKRATGLEIGKLQKLKEFNLSHPIVKAKLAERYGNKIPYGESCISPGAMFDSKLIYTVREK